jgi:folylpolyglutamate synthase/dihydropteroate synthase
MEKVSDFPEIYFDGAHNPPAMKNFVEMIDMYFKDKKRIYVVGILKRKDYEKMVKVLLLDKDAEIILTSGIEGKKYATAQELYEVALKNSRGPNIKMMALYEAIEYSFKQSLDTTSFIVGSFYTYGKVLNKIKEIKEKMS